MRVYKCKNCPYSEEEKDCPCIQYTVKEIKNIDEKNKSRKAYSEELYFRNARYLSEKRGGRLK